MAPGGARPVSERDVHTVYLGQYTHEHAEAIAERLERADIVWWYKTPGVISVIWERGVRLFVDRRRLAEAKQIAADVLRRGQGQDQDQNQDRDQTEPGGPSLGQS